MKSLEFLSLLIVDKKKYSNSSFSFFNLENSSASYFGG